MRCRVTEPSALALYPMHKTVNDTANAENRTNAKIAVRNNPDVNVEPLTVIRDGDGFTIMNVGDLIG